MKKMIDIDIDEIVKTTEKAILVKIDDDEIWLPKSQIKFETDPKNSGITTVISGLAGLAVTVGLVGLTGLINRNSTKAVSIVIFFIILRNF